MADTSLNRRQFLVASSLIAFHLQCQPGAAASLLEPGRGPRIRRIRMQTHALPELRDFYSQKIGFRIAAESSERVLFDAGQTQIEFEQVNDGSQPFYHFAFNIPENKLELARPWLAQRATILRHARNGNEVIHFENWNAHSLFFYDPAGNLAELIARHTLPNAAPGEFTTRDLLYASEIGFCPPQQGPVFDDIRQRLQIQPYLDSSSFLGDEYGILIVIPPDVKWIPEFKKSGMLFPTQVAVAGHGQRQLRFPDLPFEIHSTP